MPNAKNLPTYYDEYVELAKRTKKNNVLPLLNRFIFRYRLAESFEGMIAPDVGRTLLGYNVITKVFLAYTAYEGIVKAARRLYVRSVLTEDLNTIFDTNLASRLRQNEKLVSYLLENTTNPGLVTKIKLSFDESTSDVLCIAYALRNIFVHGDLTATSVGTETKAKRNDFINLANALLDYCDDKFTLCLRKL